MAVKKCAMCGQPFVQASPVQKLCSAACVKKYNTLIAKGQFVKRKCRGCGKTFEAPVERLYCSAECRNKAIEADQEKRLLKTKVDPLDETLRYCKRTGLTYAQYQMQQTISNIRENDEKERTKKKNVRKGN